MSVKEGGHDLPVHLDRWGRDSFFGPWSSSSPGLILKMEEVQASDLKHKYGQGARPTTALSALGGGLLIGRWPTISSNFPFRFPSEGGGVGWGGVGWEGTSIEAIRTKQGHWTYFGGGG